MPKKVVKWIHVGDMGEEEMAGHPEYETIGGCLKVIDGSGKRQAWWDALPDHEKNIIKSLPNFDPGIFEECTGIKVGGCFGSRSKVIEKMKTICSRGLHLQEGWDWTKKLWKNT